MAINLRSIGPVLHADLKIAAAKAGKPLEFFCIQLLRQGLNAGGLAGSSPAARPVIDFCPHDEWVDGEQYGCRLAVGHKGKCELGEKLV